MGEPRRFGSSFFLLLTDLVEVCRLLVLCLSPFTWLITLVISSSATTKSEIIFESAHQLMQTISTASSYGEPQLIDAAHSPLMKLNLTLSQMMQEGSVLDSDWR